MSVSVLNSKDFTASSAARALDNAQAQMGQSQQQLVMQQNSSEAQQFSSNQFPGQNCGHANSHFANNNNHHHHFDQTNYVNQASKRHYLNQCLVQQSPIQDRQLVQSRDLESLHSCFHNTFTADEIKRTYQECNHDREAAFDKLSKITNRDGQLSQIGNSNSQGQSPSSSQKQVGSSSSMKKTNRRRTREEFQRTATEVTTSISDQRESLNQSAVKNQEQQLPQKQAQQPDSKQILSEQIINELQKGVQSKEQAEGIVLQGLTYFESQHKNSQPDKDKELALFQNNILKKGIRKMQSICEDKITQAQNQAAQIQFEAQKQINEARRVQDEQEMKDNQLNQEKFKNEQLQYKNEQLQKQLASLWFAVKNHLSQEQVQPHLQQFNNGSGFQGGPGLC